jgi:hypothetical protein
MQAGSTPTPLTSTTISSWGAGTANVSLIVGTSAGGGGTSATGLQVPGEAVPAYGLDDTVASYAIAGQRQGDKIPVQGYLTSMTITAPWNPSDAALLLIRADAYNGMIDRTYVAAGYDGSTTIAYSFNARVGSFQIDAAPGAEAKCVFTLHPRLYGWSNS